MEYLTLDYVKNNMYNFEDFPILTEEQEYRCTVDVFENNNLESAKKLVLSHMYYVVKQANLLSGYGLDLRDLVQEGLVGMMRALKAFNPYRGIRLITFASRWVKAEMYEYIVKNWRQVKIVTTKVHRKLFFKKSRLDEKDALIKELGVTKKQIDDMEYRLNGTEVPIALEEDDDECSNVPPISKSLKADQTLEPENQLALKDNTLSILMQEISKLPERTQDILKSRHMVDVDDKATYVELGKKYGVSHQRIEQIEKSAFLVLRNALNKTELCRVA